MATIIAYIVTSVAIGFIGRNSRFGFYGICAASVMFTPLIGILLIFAAPKKGSGDIPVPVAKPD
jgi:hypothetical protein